MYNNYTLHRNNYYSDHYSSEIIVHSNYQIAAVKICRRDEN